MLDKLHATEGRIEAAFRFFLRKRAPVSGLQSLLDYQGRWIAETRAGATTRVGRGGGAGEEPVPVLEGDLRLRRAQPALAGDDARRAAAAGRVARAGALRRGQASSEIWPMLKRPDEKWVTERAYENPKFVEDLVRDVALR
jgi:GTP cyclohydrolase IB